MKASCGCGRRWIGHSEAHCAVCHAHFSTVSGFDRHKPDTAGCLDPLDVGLVFVEGVHGITFRNKPCCEHEYKQHGRDGCSRCDCSRVVLAS